MTAAITLPADPQAAGLARRFLARELSGPDQEAVREVGQLLVSEMVTNAIVHAASAVDVEVTRDGTGTIVRVRDADTGPLVSRAGGGSELDEGGRGFMLIDRLADAWGTEHQGGRKTVWFRLPDPATTGDGATRPAQPAAADKAPSGPAVLAPANALALRTLLLRPVLEGALTFEEHVGELLARIVDAVDATGGQVSVATTGARPISRGDTSGAAPYSRELVAGDQRLGLLTIHAPDAPVGDQELFLELAADRLALLGLEHGVLQSEQGRARDQDFLSEVSELLAGSLSVSLSLTLLTQIVIPRLADWAGAFSVDERGRPRRLTANHRREESTDAVNDLLGKDRELRQAVRDAALGKPAQRLPAAVAVGGQRSHVVVLPLASRSRVLGVLVLGRSEPLDAVKFMAAIELGRRAALAIDNARLHEQQVSTATALQKSLLPLALPVLDGVELAARYHSASPGMSVGGDFYDAFTVAGGSAVLTIGDVCGKGAEAAAVTGMSRDLLRLLAQDGVAPAPALRRLNRALGEREDGSRFCTVAVTRLARSGDELTARICLAGHPEPVVLRADGTTELVGTPGDLLGVLDDDELQLIETDVALGVGDALVLYTDGVTERRDGRRMFGQHGLRKTLEQSAGGDADAIAHALEQAAEAFVDSELRDDLAILVVRRGR